jgi:hypothetical protein
MRAMGWDDERGDEATAASALRAAIARHEREPLAPLLRARGLGGYRGYAEMLESIAHAVSGGASLSRIGRTPRGEPILALSLGAGRSGGAIRSSVVVAGLHPLEWIGVEVALRVLGRLAGADLGGRGVTFIPIANPDGIIAVEANLRGRRRRFVRHNAHGVDLNRNFDASWGRSGVLGRLLRALFSPGSRAASEPEVEAIAHHLSNRRVDRALSLHSFGGVVLTPYAAHYRPPHDALEHHLWASRIARAADPRPYRALQCSRWGWVRSGGLELDWFHERHGAISLLVECSRGGVGLRPSRLLDPFAWFNPPRLEAEAETIASAVEPFVKGLDE